MSSRHLRRVLGDKSLDETRISSSDEENARPVNKPSKFTSFGVLLTSDEEEDETSEDFILSESEVESEIVNKAPIVVATKKSVDSDEEFEAALDQLQTKMAEAKDSGQDVVEELDQFLVLLAPNSTSMDPLAELKRKIGNFNPAAAGAADQRFAGLIERRAAAAGKRPGRHASTKAPSRKGRYQLISAQPTWPSVPATAIGLELERADDSSGFIMQHSDDYLRGLRTAVYLMRQGDIEGLVALIHAGCPYQVDALLVVSDYVRMSSSAEAAELVEWSIYLMERCLGTGIGTAFNAFSEKDRGNLLPYDYAENRKMHLGLFRHVQYQLKRGCYKTALEFCKLMLCLDATDPLMVMPLMATAALQAQKYEWILEMRVAMMEWKGDQVDWLLTSILALFKLDRLDEASAMLVDLCHTYPGILGQVAIASGMAGNLSELGGGCPHAAALAKVFLTRTGNLWNDRQVTVWLQSSWPEINGTTTRQDDTIWLDPYEHAKIYRHTLLSDVANLNIPLPPSMASMELNVYDPIPPEKIDGSSPSVVGMLADGLANILSRFRL
jgi:hypothetical protein